MMWFFSSLIFTSCLLASEKYTSTEEDIVYVEPNPGDCQPRGSFRVERNEALDSWKISADELIEKINEYDTCIWSSDGSVSKMRSEMFSDFVIARENVSHWDGAVCDIYFTFVMKTFFFDEHDNQLLQTSPSMKVKSRRLSSDDRSFQYVEFPPPHPPSENEMFFMYSYFDGDLTKGDIEEVRLEVFSYTPDRDVFVDDAFCYKE